MDGGLCVQFAFLFTFDIVLVRLDRYSQRKDIFIEHRAGKARRPAWLAGGKCSQASFVGDGIVRVFPMRARFPRNETLDSLSTLTS